MNRASTIGGSMKRCRRDRDMVSLRKKKKHTKALHSMIFCLSSESETPLSGPSTIKSCAEETSPQNNWLWKPTGNMSWKTVDLYRKEDLLLRGSCTDPLTPQNTAETPNQKVHRLWVKETHLLILEHLLVMRGAGGPPPRDWDLGSRPLGIPPVYC